MFKFTEESVIVGSWVRLILADIKTYEEVPNIFGLKEAVLEVLASMGIVESK